MLQIFKTIEGKLCELDQIEEGVWGSFDGPGA